MFCQLLMYVVVWFCWQVHFEFQCGVSLPVSIKLLCWYVMTKLTEFVTSSRNIEYLLIEFVFSGTANQMKSPPRRVDTEPGVVRFSKYWSDSKISEIRFKAPKSQCTSNSTVSVDMSFCQYVFILASIYDLSSCEHFHLDPPSSCHVFIEN